MHFLYQLQKKGKINTPVTSFRKNSEQLKICTPLQAKIRLLDKQFNGIYIVAHL